MKSPTCAENLYRLEPKAGAHLFGGHRVPERAVLQRALQIGQLHAVDAQAQQRIVSTHVLVLQAPCRLPAFFAAPCSAGAQARSSTYTRIFLGKDLYFCRTSEQSQLSWR